MTHNIIEGIKIDIKSGELRALLCERAEAIRAKITACKEEIAKEKARPQRSPEEVARLLGSAHWPGPPVGPPPDQIVASLERRVASLTARALALSFTAEHLIPEVVYRVDALAIGAQMLRSGAGAPIYVTTDLDDDAFGLAP